MCHFRMENPQGELWSATWACPGMSRWPALGTRVSGVSTSLRFQRDGCSLAKQPGPEVFSALCLSLAREPRSAVAPALVTLAEPEPGLLSPRPTSEGPLWQSGDLFHN